MAKEIAGQKVEGAKENTDMIVTKTGKHNPLEHLGRYKCPEGHSNWNPKNVLFVMDHQAHAVECMSCRKTYFIHIGVEEVLPAPDGFVADINGEN